MKLAMVAAGFSPGEADQLRRAMGAWRRPGVIDAFRDKLIDGMRANGYPEEFGLRLFKQIRGFGEYGFPESHAASFALLVYVSCYLKQHYHAAFTAALLNSQPMGFYAPAQLIRDAKDHGVEVRPVDVNHSQWDCTLEPLTSDETSSNGASNNETTVALRLGLRMVKGFSQRHADRISQARQERPYTSFDDLVQRTGLSQAVFERLAEADTLGSLQLERRPAVWQALPPTRQLPLFDDLDARAPQEPEAALPTMPPLDEVTSDYNTIGLSLRAHPMSFVRERLDEENVVTCGQLATLPPDRRYRVAGLVLLRQRPSTAKGVTFMTLEDETGIANLIIWQSVWERFHRAARNATVMLAAGRLQRQDEVIHLLVEHILDRTPLLAEVRTRSRDFH